MGKDKHGPLEGYENVISLMNLYREEWKHRDNAFITMFWRFIYISLVVTFLPYFIKGLAIEKAPIILLMPMVIFPIAGIVCALFGMYLALGEAKRIEAIDLKYKDIMSKLPKEYRMIALDDQERIARGKYYSIRLNNLLCIVPYSVVIVLAIFSCITLLK